MHVESSSRLVPGLDRQSSTPQDITVTFGCDMCRFVQFNVPQGWRLLPGFHGVSGALTGNNFANQCSFELTPTLMGLSYRDNRDNLAYPRTLSYVLCRTSTSTLLQVSSLESYRTVVRTSIVTCDVLCTYIVTGTHLYCAPLLRITMSLTVLILVDRDTTNDCTTIFV